MSVIQFKQANCKNCYKCIRSCPIKAIKFKDEQAEIIGEECILCGNCLRICPQNAKSVRNDLDKVKEYIRKKEKVYVSLAPSFISAYEGVGKEELINILKQLGFTHVEETAAGAAMVSKEYENILKSNTRKNIITSACPSVVSLIEKYYPEIIDNVAPVVSPMVAHAKMIRKIYGNRIKVVFIGPCISKKEESEELQFKNLVNGALTFEELEQWIKEEGILYNNEIDEKVNEIKNVKGRIYPTPGGIIASISKDLRRKYKLASIDGVDRCISILDSIKNGEISNYFIEMNTCSGGCLGGPCIKQTKGGLLKSKDLLMDYIKNSPGKKNKSLSEQTKVNLTRKIEDKSAHSLIPNEAIINDILNKIGKFNKEQELNCGACGYHTCREKAIAVYNRKAELHMCLPYMRERAESISNIIINSTPNAIIALDEDLRIQEINSKAEEIFKCNNETAKSKNIFEIYNFPGLADAIENKENVLNKKCYYEEYNLYVEQSIIYIDDYKLAIILIKDITQEEKEKEERYKLRTETLDITQDVINKQMRVAQEIASLLGETTAETKIALTKLKSLVVSRDEIA